MVSRCTKPNYTGFHKYGGAGIGVYAGWKGREGFVAFCEHIGPRPTMAHQIDRIDGTKGYEPGNVRWATSQEQNRNRKDNVNLTLHGETHCMAEWAERLGVTRQSLHKRINKWGVERALTAPRRNYPEAGLSALRQQGGSER